MDYIALIHAAAINVDKKKYPQLYKNYKNLLRKLKYGSCWIS
jgi:hypothetical protein